MEVNPNDVLKDFSTVVCLLLKDGSEYSFIHRSIQEYFYSSFISNKSPIAKEKFYSKLLQDESFYSKLRNVVSFLAKSDNYNYHKYFKLPIIDNYIDVFNVTNNSSTFIDSFYVSIREDSKLRFQLINKDILNYHIYSIPDTLHLLYGSIHENMIKKYESMVFGLSNSTENLEDNFIKVKDFDDTELHNLIKNETLVKGRKLIETKNDILESIRKKDGIEFNLE